MRVFKPTYKTNGQDEPRPGPRWYVAFRDHRGVRRRVVAFTDKAASTEFGRKVEKLVALVGAGERPDSELARWIETMPPDVRGKLTEWDVLERTSSLVSPLLERDKARRVIGGHVHDYHAALIAKGRTKAYADLRRARVANTLDGCGFAHWRDIRAGVVESWLADERQAGRMKQRTSNHYVTALKGFCAWMVEDRRAATSRVDGLEALGSITDEERYGVFTIDQVRKLLTYCNGATDVWGVNQRRPRPPEAPNGATRFMTGPQRATVYRFAVETALRADVIRHLTMDQIRFERDRAGQVVGGVVRTSVGQQKNRRAHDVPLRRRFASELADHLTGKAGAVRPFDLPKFAAEMLRQDLFNARVPLVDEDGLPLRFHSFRPTCATWLGEAGLSATDIASITGHQTRAMVDHYTHATRRAGRKAIEALPELVSLRATGTDDAGICAPLVHEVSSADHSCPTMSAPDMIKAGGVAERLKAPVLKTGRPVRVSWVRIPPPPFRESHKP